MATVKFYLDTRSIPPDVPAPLKIMISHNRTTALHPVEIRLLPSQWDGAAGCVTEHPQRMFLNAHLFRMRSDWEIAMLKLADSGELRRACNATVLRGMILQTLYPERYGARNLFFDRYLAFTESRATPGTRRTYAGTIPRLEAYDPQIRTRTFEDIDRSWLAGFEKFLSRTARSANARAIHFRNIRAVFNDAIDDEITAAYPFRKFKIRQAPTRKRAMSVESLRLLAGYPCEEYQEIYRDMFVLMFCLIGINAVDLLNAPAGAVVDGRLEYVRAKTHKPYSIKVEPEAAALIEKYRGQDHLLNVMDGRKNYVDFLHRMNNALKEIGPLERKGLGGKKYRQPLFPQISQYWCRHTWATIASGLDIPKETIAHALGHSCDTVTDIYIDFDMGKVDAANRKVLDFVFGQK